MALRFEILSQRSTAMPVDPASHPTIVALAATDSTQGAASTPTRESTPPAEWTFVGPPTPTRIAEPPPTRVVVDTLRRGDSIYLSLKRHRVSERQLALLDQALSKVFNPAKVKPDDYYALTLDTLNVIRRFRYTPHREPDRPVHVELRDSLLVGRQLALPLDRRTETLVVRIEDNLSNAISQAGEGDALTDRLADKIYGAVIDFQLDPRRGDQIGIVFEKFYQDERFIRYGRVLLASYTGQQVDKLGIYFTDAEGEDAYFDADGQSLGRMFLLKPLSVRRITSRFNRKRFHPILKKRVPHLGTDYGAATGTKVWTTARGLVTHAGRKGGYGKLVEVTHPNGYRTRYAHLSKILVRKGQRVQQQQLIGKVGATGRATGPHLHYEIIRDDRHINPESVNKGATGQPLAKDLRPAFALRRDALLSTLAIAKSQARLAAIYGD
jgi:murein DD-endopeptidase MepM/ murein hydrolase activator NlpD